MSKYLKPFICFALAAALTLVFSACNSCSCRKTPEPDPTVTLAPTEKSEEPTSLPPTEEPSSETEPVEEVVEWSSSVHDELWGEADIRFSTETGYTLRQDTDFRDCCRIYTMDGAELRFDFYGMYYETGLESLIGYMKGQNPDKLFFNEDTKLLIEVHSREKTEVNARINDNSCLTIIGPDLETIQRVLDNIHIRILGVEFDPLAGGQDLTVLYGQDE